MEKTSLLILHGWQVPAKRYLPLKEIFAPAGFELFVLRLPGFGDGPSLDRAWSLSDYADWVQEYIQKKGLKKVFLIGHSFGGRVAIKLSVLHPEKIKALVLTGVPAIKNKSVKITLFKILAKIGKGLFAIPPLIFMRNFARRVLYLLAGERDYYRAEGVMRKTLKKAVAEDLLPLLSKIKAPTLLIWGRNDKVVPVSIAERMVKKIPKAELIVIPKASHKLPYENPEVFTKKCLKFFHSLL